MSKRLLALSLACLIGTLMWLHKEDISLCSAPMSHSTDCPACPATPPTAAPTVNSRKLPSLKEVFRESGTDKFSTHGYFRHYELIFGDVRRSVDEPRMVEIGVYDGNSLMAWHKYFGNFSLIAGLAGGPVGKWQTMQGLTKVEDKKYHYSSNGKKPVTIYAEADQTNEDYLNWFIKDSGGNFDIVLDDASHIPWHQLFTFAVLFPHVKEGGWYILEDLETSYWDAPDASLYDYPIEGAGVGKPPPGNAIELLKLWIDVINRAYLNDMDLHVFHKDLEHMIASITFASNCAIIRKGIPADDAPYMKNLLYGPHSDGHSHKAWTEKHKNVKLPKIPKSFEKL